MTDANPLDEVFGKPVEGEGVEPQAVEQVEPAPEAPAAAEPPAAVEPPVPMAPITALLDEREKRQKAEAEAKARDEQLRRAIAEIQALRQPPKVPDMLDDPEGRLAYERSVAGSSIRQVKLDMARAFAEQQFGADAVNEAVEYFNANPHLAPLTHQFAERPLPYHEAVNFVRKLKAGDAIGGDPESWAAKERERIRAELLAEMQASQPAARPTIPGSIATARAAGTTQTMPRGSAFDRALGKS